jgi:V8-like Glu-specific endopeptidase
MRRIILLAAILSFPLLAAAQLNNNTIYGNDDRVDLYQVKDTRVLSLADSTIALFESGKVSVNGPTATLTTAGYGESRGLCKEERFWEQHIGAFCSGSLVAPDIIMTAGHCVTSDESCADTKFVFGFSIAKEGESPDSVPAGEVYGCAKLLGRLQEAEGADWALVRLDRPVSAHKPLKLSSGSVSQGDPVFVIGHPAGLPTKVAGGAKVRDASKPGFFVANLDTYGGNSGSAVFNGKTGLVEGILVRGDQDYVQKGDCEVSKVCPDDGCRGEDVTKIANVTPNIPPSLRRRDRIASVGSLPEMLAAFASTPADSKFDSAR